MRKRRKRRRYKRKRKSFIGKLFKLSILLGFWGLVSTVLIVLYYSIGLPDINSLPQNSRVINNLQVRYSNKKLIKKYGSVSDNSAIYSELPIPLIEALVATEDRRFFEHHGVDIFGISRALYINTKEGRIKQGGSTLTQQLAKMMFLSRERTLKRKIQEAILAIKLERIFSKEQIMTFYLNKAYFGAGKYGIKDASRFYFDKEPSELNLEESAMLVGLLKAPSRYSPVNNPELAKQRADQIIANMANVGFLTEKTAKGMMANNITIYQNSFNKKNQSYYFSDWVKNQI